MTISSEVRKAGPFSGNDLTTSFPFAFKVFDKGDLRVVRTMPSGIEADLILDSDYSVALNPDQDATPGGTVTFPISGDPLAEDWKLTIVGDIDALQPTDLTNGGGFYPQVIENMSDRLTMLVQQLAEGLSRAVKVPVSGQTPPEDLLEDIKEDVASAHASALSAQESAAAAEESASRVDLGALDQAVEDSQQAQAAAEGARDVATTSAGTATSQADRAESEADRAEGARNTAIDVVSTDYRPVDDVALAEISGMTQGQTALVRSTLHVWVYDGSEWQDQGPSPLRDFATIARVSGISNVEMRNIAPAAPGDLRISAVSWVGGQVALAQYRGKRVLNVPASPAGAWVRRFEFSAEEIPAGMPLSVALTVDHKTAGEADYNSTVGVHIRLRAYNSGGGEISGAWAADAAKSDYPADTTIFRRYLGRATLIGSRVVVCEGLTMPLDAAKIGLEIYVTNTVELTKISGLTIRAGAVSDLMLDDGNPPAGRWVSSSVPGRMGWPQAYKLTPRICATPSGRFIGDSGLVMESVFPDFSAWQTIYVNRGAGSDTGGDGSSGAPYQSIARAIAAMNTSGSPATISVAGAAHYDGRLTFAAPLHKSATYRGVQPEQDVRFLATGGVVTASTAFSLAWTQSGAYPQIYSASIGSLATVGRVFNILSRDRVTGSYIESRPAPSLAVCAVMPGSYFVDGTTIYYFPADAVAPTNTNTRVYAAAQNFKLTGAEQVNVMFDVADARCGWDLEGGSRNGDGEYGGALDVQITSVQSTEKVLLGKNCRFRYSSKPGVVENAFTAYNWHGLLYFGNSDASFGGRDCWNVHSLSANKTHFLLENCSGHYPGQLVGAGSANSWTLHESCKGIVIGGDFTGGSGIPVYIVGSSFGWAFGARLRGGLGDYYNGENIKPILVGCDGSSQLWLEDAAIDPDSFGQLAVRAQNTAVVRVRRTELPGGIYKGGGARVVGF